MKPTKPTVGRNYKPSWTTVDNFVFDSEGILTANEKLVFLTINRYFDDFYPSVSKLARKCNLTEPTIRKTIRSLIDKGFIIKEHRRGKDGSNLTNKYILNFDPVKWLGDAAENTDGRFIPRELAKASDADLMAELRRRGLLPETEKAASNTETTENITYMEKAPALSTDQSESTDTLNQTNNTAAKAEDHAIFFDNDSTEPVENASVNVSKDHPNETDYLIDTIANTVDRSAPGLLTHKDCRAAAKELIKFNPDTDIDHLCSLASELTMRMDKAYHAGKVRKPIAYLITAIQRERSRNHAKDCGISGASSVPMGGDLTHEHKSASTMKAFLDTLNDDGGGGNGG